ncbi:MAG: DnaJ domain-containing protein [Acidimicrobiia bacterium]|nr:DnaJ domain-containing protein [Acidimicrobiia bacterium]
MRTRGDLDHYAVLGLAPDATAPEIGAAFRRLAKTLHPDRRPGGDGAERFKQVTAAYEVLGDAVARRAYDATRVPACGAPAPAVVPVPPVPGHRRAWFAVVGGAVLLVAGLVTAVLVLRLQQRDAAVRERGVPVRAVVVGEEGGRRLLELTTLEGETVRVREPLRTGQPAGGRDTTSVALLYDRSDPTRVTLAADTTARDVTLWIVAAKLVLAGLTFVSVGGFWLRPTRERL